MKLDDAVYKKYKRTKVGYDGKIDLTRFGSEAPKPLFWAYDVATEKADPKLKKLSSTSMITCIDNIPKVAEEFKKQEMEKAK